MTEELAGKRALVTGSSSGIGAGIARALAAEGASVIVHGRDQGRAREVADGIRTKGGTAEVVTADLASEVAELERRHRLEATPDLDLGLAPAVHHWVSGGSLSSILAASWQEGVDLTAGDFVRSVRLVVDVLSQIGQVAEPDLARVARSAVGSIRRGVVLDSTA